MIMRKKEYTDTLKRINGEIAKYLEFGFTPLNPKQHLFELIGWRNKLTYTINAEEDLKRFKNSGDEYRLLYVWNLKDFIKNKTQYDTSK